jgi:hypothetical protein
MKVNLQELQKSVNLLIEQNKAQEQKLVLLRKSHIKTYDRLDIIEDKLMTHEETVKIILKQMSADSKSFQLQIVQQNEKMAKLEVITQQNQNDIKANQLGIKNNQENIAVSIQALKISMDDLMALRRDYNKLHDTVNED